MQCFNAVIVEKFNSISQYFLQWYYFFCFRNVSPSKYATPLKWAMTGPGMTFLLSGKWASDMAVASRLYIGKAGVLYFSIRNVYSFILVSISLFIAMPAFSVTRAYCKELLCETFNYLLLPDDTPDDKTAGRDNKTALRAFKVILKLAKEANACLLNDECNENKNIKGAAGCSDSGELVRVMGC